MLDRSQQINPMAIANEPFLAIDRRNHAVDRCVRAALNAKLSFGALGRLPAWQGLISVMSYATFSRGLSIANSIAISPSPFNALLFDKRRTSAQGAPS
jgi:hypothetical protein